jgi:hypothetical protein
MAMMNAAKEKFDPKNFQTLKEQDRPGVFRPVAVNMPAQQQTANTAMRMQQMAAQGVRPVGMARGGLTEDFYSSPYERSYDLALYNAANNKDFAGRDYALPSYDPETMAPTLSSDVVEPTVSSDESDLERIAKIRRRLKEIGAMPVEASVKPKTKSSGVKDLALFPDSTATTTYEGGPMANDYGNVSVAKTRAGRAIQDLLGKNQPLSENKYAGLNLDDPTLWTDEQIDTVSKRFPGNEEGTASALRAERQMARDTKGGPRAESIRENLLKQQEELGNIEKRAPVPGLFEEASPLQVQKAEEARAAEVQRRRAEAESEGSIQTPKQESPLGTTEEPSTTSAVSSASGEGGVASLVGSGRGSVNERAGERAAYLRSRFEGGGGGGNAAPTQTKKDTPLKDEKEYPTSMPDIKRDREDAFNMALMMAGLGMMSGKSSNALANIGEGGIMGLKAYADQLNQSRARALEDRKMNMLDKYYGSREKALAASGEKSNIAWANLKLNAEKAAAKEVADAIKANPVLANDKKQLDLIREDARNRYISTIMDTTSMTAATAPQLNADAEPLF